MRAQNKLRLCTVQKEEKPEEGMIFGLTANIKSLVPKSGIDQAVRSLCLFEAVFWWLAFFVGVRLLCDENDSLARLLVVVCSYRFSSLVVVIIVSFHFYCINH